MFNNLYKIVLPMILSLSVNTALMAAGDGHNHSHDDAKKSSDHAHGSMSPESSGMFLKKKKIDGYDVSFHVMKAADGMRHGGSHNFMIKVEKNGKALKDVVINSKVVHPDKKSESKMLLKMGDWYMNGYDLDHEGKHQMMILFKTSDGKKHKGGVYYAK